MISFTKSGNKVKASIEYKSGDVDTRLFFYWQCGEEVQAEALACQLQKFMQDSVEREIKTAYESGYQAGRKKKTKRTWFHDYISHINKPLPDWKKE